MGVRDAARSAGFGGERTDHVFLQAAENFFRPEFINRLDRIIPFHSLNRDDVEQIARLLMDEVFAREGLQRRRCILHVDERAVQQVVDHGYHPQWGARALKRAIEQQLTSPVARRLATFSPEVPTVIGVYPHSTGIRVYVQELRDAEPLPRPARDWSPERLLERCDQFLSTIDDLLEADRPRGSFSVQFLEPRHWRYFAISEQVERIRGLSRQIQQQREAEKHGRVPPALAAEQRRTPAKSTNASYRRVPTQRFLKEALATGDIAAYLSDVVVAAKICTDDLMQLENEVAVLNAMVREQPKPGRALLLVRSVVDQGRETAHELAAVLAKLFEREYGFRCTQYSCGPTGDHLSSGTPKKPSAQAAWRFLLITGQFAELFAQCEVGVHLVHPAQGVLVPVQICSIDLDGPAEVIEPNIAERILAFLDRRRLWVEQVEDLEAPAESDPLELGRVIRIHDQAARSLIDLRSGLTLQHLDAATVRQLATTSFPLPPELET